MEARLGSELVLAPDFAAEALDGAELQLAALQGRPVVLFLDVRHRDSPVSEVQDWLHQYVSEAHVVHVLDTLARPGHVDLSPYTGTRVVLPNLEFGSKYWCATSSLYLVGPAGRLRFRREYWGWDSRDWAEETALVKEHLRQSARGPERVTVRPLRATAVE